MDARIAIVSIFDLTRVFYEVSTALSGAGHQVYWITTDHYWTEWLVKQGVPNSHILELIFAKSDFLDTATKNKLLTEIVEDEAAADLTINQILMMDQFVMQKNLPDISDYAFLYYARMREFFTANRISHLIAEPTNSNEMIAYLLCRRLQISYLSPCNMRHPPHRLIFCDSHLQKTVIPRREQAEYPSGKTVIDAFTAHCAPPPYFDELNKQRVLSLGRLGKAITNRVTRHAIFRRSNLTHHDLSGRVNLMRRRMVNGFVLRHLFPYPRLDQISGKIAYYPLHVQPESSIDVLGSYFSDQVKLIRDIRRALPFDVTLVVKEHPNFLGSKKLSLYREIRRIPGVKLVKHDESSMAILKRAVLLFSVSGTAAFEAGMLGIPAIVFSQLYFDGLSSIHYCSDITRLRELAGSLISSKTRDYAADCRHMDRLMANSYDASWSDPLLYPNVLDSENVTKLRQAFLSVVSDAHS